MRRGFSLLEMVAALALLLIVSAIILTVYAQVRQTGYERLARARVETVLQAQYVLVAAGGGFTDDQALLRALTADVSLTTDTSPDFETVSMAVAEDGSLGLAVLVPGDRCVIAGVTAPAQGSVVSFPHYQTGTSCHGALGLQDGSARLAP